MPNYPFMAVFGIVEIILSQIPSFHKLSFLSIIATVMSFSYASIGIGLAMAVVASTLFSPFFLSKKYTFVKHAHAISKPYANILTHAFSCLVFCFYIKI